MIAFGDFDRNGSPDLVTVGRYDKWASVLLAPEPSKTLLSAASLGSLLALAHRRSRSRPALFTQRNRQCFVLRRAAMGSSAEIRP